MKVLQINTDANHGSVGRISEDIGRMLMSKGDVCYIAYGRCVNPSQLILIRIGSTTDVYRHVISSRLFDNQGLLSSRPTKELIGKIREINPDLIHLHCLHGYYLNYKLLFEALRELGKPVVWTFHDCWSFTGHCAYPIYTDCNKWKSFCHHCDQTRFYPKAFFDRSQKNYEEKRNDFLSVRDLHIVTVSDWLKSETKESFFKKCDIRRIYNGIDTDIFKPQSEKLREELGLPKNKKVVLGVANVWEERKGLDDIIEIYKLLPSEFKIVLIGLNEKQRKAMPLQIMAIQRTNDIMELAAYYSMADVFVNPSKAETFGMTTAEALSCGTPAVVYNTTACPELLNNSTGRIVELGSIENMAHAIIEICEKGKAYWSENCRKRALALFSKKERYEEYYNLYSELLSDK